LQHTNQFDFLPGGLLGGLLGADADGAKGSPGKKDDEEEDGGDGDEGRAKKKRKLGEDADVSASDETGARVRVCACVRACDFARVREDS